MASAPAAQVWTWQKALALPDGERYEVINGELRERIMSFGSSAIATIVIEFLRQWMRAAHPGTVTGSDGGYTVFPWAPGDVRMPDASYISRTRLPRLPKAGWVSIAPELAVEVVSPSDRITDLEDKAQDYIRAGIDLVWVVVPSTKSVHVWRKNGERAVLREAETLSGEDVLPGLTIPVAALFEEAMEDESSAQ